MSNNTDVFSHIWFATGPGGDLRTYLEGLAVTDDVQKYVENNPFGQEAITKSHKSWEFYSKLL